MATKLKNWKEASTLVLCTKNINSSNKTTQVKNINKLMHCVKNIENQNTIIKKPTIFKQNDYDYSCLYIERSSKSSFMPSIYVYPGGVAENADFSPKWIDLFKQADCDIKELWERVNSKCLGYPANMFSRSRSSEYTSIPPDIAFRIAALRETFEETGILLAKTHKQFNISSNLYKNFHFSEASIPDKISREDLKGWRKRVYNDASAFIDLCRTFSVVPDVLSLYEWSNWLTPVYQNIKQYIERKQGQRFDTAFYICFIEVEDDIQAKEDEFEATSTKLLNPFELLHMAFTQPKCIAVPQYYENSRLANFQKFDELTKFAAYRSKYRVEQWLPCPCVLTDGLVVLFPGDELYPVDPDPNGEKDPHVISLSKDDVSKYTITNRHFPTNENNFKMITNFNYNAPTNGHHILPVSDIKFVYLDSKL